MGWVHEDFAKNRDLAYLAKVATDCERWGIPFMAEMLPYEHIPYFQRAENITPKTPIGVSMARACRMGAEFGADFIKTMYTGDMDTFRTVVAGCYVPLLVLGGEFKGETHKMLTGVWEAMQVGAHGVVMGRNIWGHPQPVKVARALEIIIHKGGSVDEAVEALT
jgi:DhnA family fructose-bisphosphate aldolase class Ia